jgi:hypothetical protein
MAYESFLVEAPDVNDVLGEISDKCSRVQRKCLTK